MRVRGDSLRPEPPKKGSPHPLGGNTCDAPEAPEAGGGAPCRVSPNRLLPLVALSLHPLVGPYRDQTRWNCCEGAGHRLNSSIQTCWPCWSSTTERKSVAVAPRLLRSEVASQQASQPRHFLRASVLPPSHRVLSFGRGSGPSIPASLKAARHLVCAVRDGKGDEGIEQASGAGYTQMDGHC
ncbi:hypothetical protein MRX96_000709 [Rhipicephalus microplus]